MDTVGYGLADPRASGSRRDEPLFAQRGAMRISATHLHPLHPPGYAPTRRKVHVEGVDVLDIREGKVTRILTAFDPIPVAEQLLGLRLRPVPGTWRAKGAVAVQRALAYLARWKK